MTSTNSPSPSDPLLDTLTARQTWDLVQAERGDTEAHDALVASLDGHQTWLLLQRERRS